MNDLPPSQSHGFNVRRAHRAFDRLLNNKLMSVGMKTGYWYYLRLLWIEDNISQKRLSDLNNVTENTTTAIVAAMVRDGLVSRSRDPSDRRSMIISLTEKARSLRAELLPFATEVNRVATRGIDFHELSICLDVLKQLSANLEEALSDAKEARSTED
jgi:DNA-binding MarR family transcriptional regulator